MGISHIAPPDEKSRLGRYTDLSNPARTRGTSDKRGLKPLSRPPSDCRAYYQPTVPTRSPEPAEDGRSGDGFQIRPRFDIPMNQNCSSPKAMIDSLPARIVEKYPLVLGK